MVPGIDLSCFLSICQQELTTNKSERRTAQLSHNIQAHIKTT